MGAWVILSVAQTHHDSSNVVINPGEADGLELTFPEIGDSFTSHGSGAQSQKGRWVCWIMNHLVFSRGAESPDLLSCRSGPFWPQSSDNLESLMRQEVRFQTVE